MDSALVKHVYGNLLKLAIPLTVKVQTEEDGVVTETDEDFYPDPAFPVNVDLHNGWGQHNPYVATMDGNVAYIEDNGKLEPSTYSIEITCVGTDGNPYRYKANSVVQVVDLTKDAGLAADVEYDARTHTLEGTIFVCFSSSTLALVQSDWNETDDTKGNYIRNKPYIPSTASDVHALPDDTFIPPAQVNSDWNAESGVAMILNKPDIPAMQVQSDWNQSDSSKKDFIKNKPTIPANVSELNNDAGYGTYSKPNGGIPKADLESSVQSSLDKADTAIQEHQDISGKEDKSNKVTGLSAQSTDIQYPSAKSVYDNIKNTPVMSGRNIDVNPLGLENTAYKTSSIFGSENDTTKYPNVKAVVDYINSRSSEYITSISVPVNASDATQPVAQLSCEVDKYYRIDVPVNTIAVTLPPVADSSSTKNVIIYLTGGTAPALTIMSSAPAGGVSPAVYYHNGFGIESGKTYEINCLYNGLAWIVASVEINTQI